MERVFVDTSAWFALANADDPDRDSVAAVLRRFSGRCLSSNYIFDETVTLCRYRFGHNAAVRWGERLLRAKGVDLLRVTAEDEKSAWQLFISRDDKAYSFTDCTSFILMRRLGVKIAIAVDEDFTREGFQTLP